MAKAANDEKKMVYDENSNVLPNGDKVIKAE
jgi:uncharacterized Zn ribbon protein